MRSVTFIEAFSVGRRRKAGPKGHQNASTLLFDGQPDKNFDIISNNVIVSPEEDS
jgi:hypothetical protein